MPYRDEKDALRTRLSELDAAVADIDARARQLDELRQDEPALRKQRDDVRSKLRALEGKRALPMLDDVRVASPCGESWSEMVGDDVARFCLKCEKNVYDLSAMTRAEAEALVSAREGELCVRFYRRADGTLLTKDCPVGVARKMRRRVAAITVLGAGLFSAGAYFYEATARCVQGAAVPTATPVVGQMVATPTPTPSAVDTAPPAEMGKPTMGSVRPADPGGK